MSEHYQLHYVSDKAVWEQAVARWPAANFLQAWNWRVFQEKMGKQTWCLGWQATDQQWVALALVVKEKAKRGTYFTIAGGPLLDWTNSELLDAVWADLVTLAKTEKVDFIRFRPQVTDSPAIREQITRRGGVLAPMHLTADITVQVDLQPDLEQILAGFRKSTRYEVRRAEKMGIRVEMSENPADIQLMHEHQLELAKKHGFVPFSLPFWLHQFESFVGDKQVALFHAYEGNQLLASAYIIFYNQEAVYHYGTSTAANAKLPGSYACQWAAIQEAKRRGCTRYNLWGIAPPNQPNHRFAGVTVFKLGFSEQVTEFVPAHDIPTGMLYNVTRLFELGRKKLRRL